METYELRYFVAAARLEGVHAAARELSISAGSISKAVARLEDELGVLLFQREGRGLRLTAQGRSLLERASSLLALEASIRAEMSGRGAEIRHVVVGTECLLAGHGILLADRLRAAQPQAVSRLAFHTVANDEEAYEAVVKGDAAFAVAASAAPASLVTRPLGTTLFRTYAGPGHPLYKSALREDPVGIETVLRHAFAMPTATLFGRLAERLSPDGWSDELYPRVVALEATTLSLLLAQALAGRALVHVPDIIADGTSLAALRVEGCSSSCRLDARVAAKTIPYGALLAALTSPLA